MTLSYIGIVLFILFSMYGYLDYSLRQPFNEQITSHLKVQGRPTREFLLEMLPDEFNYEVVDNLVDRIGKATTQRLTFIGMDGVVWGDTEALVDVKDTGTGILEDALERIFERFYRVDKARSREMASISDWDASSGTGLGLSIVKHILLLHSGRIWAESVVGEGSVFHFVIPISSAAA